MQQPSSCSGKKYLGLDTVCRLAVHFLLPNTESAAMRQIQEEAQKKDISFPFHLVSLHSIMELYRGERNSLMGFDN